MDKKEDSDESVNVPSPVKISVNNLEEEEKVIEDSSIMKRRSSVNRRQTVFNPSEQMAGLKDSKSTMPDNSSPNKAKKVGTLQTPSKTLYLFSNIFEKSKDIKNNPFIFEKHDLQKRESVTDFKT